MIKTGKVSVGILGGGNAGILYGLVVPEKKDMK